MNTLNWIMLMLIVSAPFIFALVVVVIGVIPDCIVFMHDLFAQIVDEWRELPRRLK